MRLLPVGVTILVPGALLVRVMLFYFKVYRSRLIASEKYLASVKERETELKDFLVKGVHSGNGQDISNLKNQMPMESGQSELLSSNVRLTRRFAWISYMSSNKFGFILFTMRAAILLSGFLIAYREDIGCLGCVVEKERLGFLVFVIIFETIQIVSALYSIRKEPDPLEIRKEVGYGLTVGFFGIFIPGYIQIVDPGDLFIDGRFDWSFVAIIGLVGLYSIVVPWQLKKAKKYQRIQEHMLKNPSESFSQLETLDDILNNETALALFKVHLTDEYSFENYQFYDTIQSWKEMYGDMTRRSKQRFCNLVADIYLKNNAILELNISQQARLAVLADIQEEKFEENVFDKVSEEIRGLLERDALMRFKMSNKYRNWKENELQMEDVDLGYD